MTLADYLILGLIAVVLCLVVFYLVRAKKKGSKCIGCPNGAACSSKCGDCCGHCGSCDHQK